MGSNGNESGDEPVSEERFDTDFETIQIDREGRMAWVVLNRPRRMNAITSELLEELSTAVEMLDSDSSVRCLLLTGGGSRAFSIGADLRRIADEEPSSLQGVELSRTGQQTISKLETCDTPVVAAIDGLCLGGGMEVAMAADLRIATDASTFAQPEHDLGLVPGWGGTQRLSQLIGESRAKEIIFTRDRYTASEMADYGFLTTVVDSDEFESRTVELGQKLASGPPIAQKYTKRALRAGRTDMDAGLETEAQAFGQLLATDDFEEGLTAYLNDDDPEFNGT